MKRILSNKRLGTAMVIVAVTITAGTATYASLRPKRDVTTSSEEAYRNYLRGEEAIRKHFAEEAVAAWRLAVDEDPSFSMAWMKLGSLAYTFGESDKAKSYYEHASANLDRVTERERLEIQILGAQLKGQTGVIDSLAQELIVRYPNDVDSRFRAGQRAFYARDYEKAVEAYKAVLELEPGMGEAYNMMGYSYSALSMWEPATDAFQKYAFMYPGEPNPLDSLGELYLRTGRYQDALDAFDRALDIKPDFRWASWHSALAHHGMGHTAEALRCARDGRGPGQDEMSSAMWERMEVELLHMSERPRDALAKIDDVLERDPKDIIGHFLAVMIRSGMGDKTGAAESLTRFLELQTQVWKSEEHKDEVEDSFMVLRARGFLARCRGDWPQAANAFERARGKVERWDLRETCGVDIAEALVHSALYSQAVEAARRVLNVNPAQAEAHYWAGRALTKLENYTEAREHFEAAAAVLSGADPGHPLTLKIQNRLRELPNPTS
jgi:tetratricopeptide (TPR) repeat protein